METFPSCSVEYQEKWIHAASIHLIAAQAWCISEISFQALMTLPLCDTPRLSRLWQPVTTYVGVGRLCAAVCSWTIPPGIMSLVGASCWGWGWGWALTWQMEPAWAPSSAYGGQEESWLMGHAHTPEHPTQNSSHRFLLWFCCCIWMCDIAGFRVSFQLHGCVITHYPVAKPLKWGGFGLDSHPACFVTFYWSFIPSPHGVRPSERQSPASFHTVATPCSVYLQNMMKNVEKRWTCIHSACFNAFRLSKYQTGWSLRTWIL